MPSVVSKFLEKGEQSLKINRNFLSGLIVSAAICTYGYKIAYPLLINNNLIPNNNNNNKLNNNLVKLKKENNEIQVGINADNKMLVDLTNQKKRHKKSSSTGVPTLNLRFILQFLKLLNIMIPNVLSMELMLLSGHTVFLFLRTFLSIYVANLEGSIVKFIVRKEPRNFLKQLFKWFVVAIPATFINSMIKYLECRIALNFRTRLVEHSYKLYFHNQSYYRVNVLDGRLDNCSQRLTDDIEIIANTVSHLYGQITKPLFDILLMAIALGNLVRSRSNSNLIIGPIIISGVVGISALILKLVSPRFGQLVAQEAEKKGYLRHVHSRIVANSEEIAFYNGHKVELSHLKNAYHFLVQHLEHMYGVKLWFVMLEQFLMKYVWSGAGMVVVSIPILMSSVKTSSIRSNVNDDENDNVAERTHYFTTAKNLLLTGSNAVERLMSSYKDIVELAGHTARVANMFQVLDETGRGIYRRTIVEKNDQLIIQGKWLQSANNEIILNNVPIVTPNCDIVCPTLTFQLLPGQHLLITGPNGCGKSSLFRILSGLWPIYDGELHTPRNSMFYIPQKPYLVLGNLRDQIIYPDTNVDMINKQVSEDDLRRIMQMVHLEHIVERDSFHQVKDWTDILSGGEKQRMAIARLFYHKPKYALLDECTSAVSIDVESYIYQTAIEMGITLLTITHRPTLWKFHTHILQFDGVGDWTFSELNANKRLNLKNEKEQLMKNNQYNVNHERITELNRLLGEDQEDNV